MFGMIRNALFGTTENDVVYEEREYDGGKFATVELTGKPFDEALREAVLKLLKYVGGSNEQGAGMGMTAPVCTTVFPGDDGSLQQKVKVLLRIPSQFQASPPLPSDESIQIEDREGMAVYSTHFGGYAKEVDYVNYAAKLSSTLGNEATYHKDLYFCNGYDPPMKPYGRRNEVWLLKK
ncbi:heme-binding protein 1 isoform X2 [Eublepharis macularius]|uniref:Heme-binding protein 1 n=1 Tax=Eublepharis macularius TaxID=481883 RepID=A0AA97JTD8_EUBMA|nr:heme-binding protein 1 isoform X2 [Eublepharis macularius]